jgi:hypothetical protein
MDSLLIKSAWILRSEDFLDINEMILHLLPGWSSEYSLCHSQSRASVLM